ncbi:hypothetical protein Taro_028679 [Colocasia esculenta]|uniref:Uncharacterized protein n=1 Tax=Colocasia esculenta TaxID=4460 RepID=A0A843VNU5_COLES|nr:hypothetical protein [Colocasia esculenta]
MGIAGSPTPEQLESFHSQGFLAIESFATADEVQGMTKRMEELLDDFDCTSIKSIFSTISHEKYLFRVLDLRSTGRMITSWTALRRFHSSLKESGSREQVGAFGTGLGSVVSAERSGGASWKHGSGCLKDMEFET